MTAHIPWTWRFFEVISTSKNQLPKTLGRSRSFGAVYEVLSWVSVQECWVNSLKWGRVQFHSCLLMIAQDWATLFVKQSENLFLSLDWNHSLVMDFKNGLREHFIFPSLIFLYFAWFSQFFLKKHIFKKLRWSAGSRGQGSNSQNSFNDTTLLWRRPKLRVLLGSRAILPQNPSIPEIWWWNETHPVFLVDVWISNGLTRIWWYDSDSGSPGAFRRTQQQKPRLIL